MAAEIFDIDQSLTDDGGKPLPYFEEQWYEVIQQLQSLQQQINDDRASFQNQIDAINLRIDGLNCPPP